MLNGTLSGEPRTCFVLPAVTFRLGPACSAGDPVLEHEAHTCYLSHHLALCGHRVPVCPPLPLPPTPRSHLPHHVLPA